MIPEIYGRRDAIRKITLGTLVFALGCNQDAGIFLHRDPSLPLERKDGFKPGDVIQRNTYHFLPRFNLYIPIPDFPFYARTTKMKKYGGQVVVVDKIGNVIMGELPKYVIDIEEFSGVRDLMRGGGEAIDLWSGLGTNEKEEIKDFTDGDLNDEPNSGTFLMQRKDLKRKGFIFAQIFNFPYSGKEKLFDWRDTTKPLADNTTTLE